MSDISWISESDWIYRFSVRLRVYWQMNWIGQAKDSNWSVGKELIFYCSKFFHRLYFLGFGKFSVIVKGGFKDTTDSKVLLFLILFRFACLINIGKETEILSVNRLFHKLIFTQYLRKYSSVISTEISFHYLILKLRTLDLIYLFRKLYD